MDFPFLNSDTCMLFISGRHSYLSLPFPVQAANPGCTLEDFVRWYSPRDYVEEEIADENGEKVVKGALSARMKIPGNMWVEAWETAKATPVRRQRRLFDDTKEAEKVRCVWGACVGGGSFYDISNFHFKLNSIQIQFQIRF